MASDFRLPVECQQVIAELAARIVEDCRDAVGKIDLDLLRHRVGDALRDEFPDVARQVRKHGYDVAIAQKVDEHIRQSKAAYAIHHRVQEGFERDQRVRARQRRYVSYLDAAGMLVHKERRFLTKAELLKVVDYYDRMKQGAQDVIDWCRAAWEQMDLMGLDDEAIVGDVIDEAPTGTDG